MQRVQDGRLDWSLEVVVDHLESVGPLGAALTLCLADVYQPFTCNPALPPHGQAQTTLFPTSAAQQSLTGKPKGALCSDQLTARVR